MRKILSFSLGGRLSMELKATSNNDVFFIIYSGNNKIISYIPAFSLDSVEQLYFDITGKEIGTAVKDYLRDIFGYKDRSISTSDKILKKRYKK